MVVAGQHTGAVRGHFLLTAEHADRLKAWTATQPVWDKRRKKSEMMNINHDLDWFEVEFYSRQNEDLKDTSVLVEVCIDRSFGYDTSPILL